MRLGKTVNRLVWQIIRQPVQLDIPQVAPSAIASQDFSGEIVDPSTGETVAYSGTAPYSGTVGYTAGGTADYSIP